MSGPECHAVKSRQNKKINDMIELLSFYFVY